MASDLPEATQREAELQRQLDGLQSQVTELHKTREESNPELSSKVQSLKEKLNEHSKQLEQSAEKLSQLESENLNLRDENQALNTASNQKRQFRAQIHVGKPTKLLTETDPQPSYRSKSKAEEHGEKSRACFSALPVAEGRD
ncbi:hypothetical protein HID58_025096 [Brassica napus]|uniref:Uncharacterized protein n=1 Tax=Brassica napus TaxID=3708 RepID=A0ABQ8CM56_BRANA|nr:hypothetical protein HID58_025096 [Brassica napus]